MNNGIGTTAATTFNNKLGNTVAFDVDNLQITYDLNDGVNNPSNVRMDAADLGGTGACAPNACAATQIRKVNIILTARSKVASCFVPVSAWAEQVMTYFVSSSAAAKRQ